MNNKTPSQSDTSYLKSRYNHESGNKTLILVGILIILITIFCIASIILLNQKPTVIIK